MFNWLKKSWYKVTIKKEEIPKNAPEYFDIWSELCSKKAIKKCFITNS